MPASADMYKLLGEASSSVIAWCSRAHLVDHRLQVGVLVQQHLAYDVLVGLMLWAQVEVRNVADGFEGAGHVHLGRQKLLQVAASLVMMAYLLLVLEQLL